MNALLCILIPGLILAGVYVITLAGGLLIDYLISMDKRKPPKLGGQGEPYEK